jgi:hypothetical protein
MMLALHILLKDLRRHCWEIGLYLVSVAGWMWQSAHPNPWIRSNASALFPVMMFVVWFILIIRVVQGESLTGTREYWTTRPYRAGQLILAKFAALVLFLHLPLFLAECWLIHESGADIGASVLLGLIALQAEFFCILTLPAAALAAITDSIVQWVMAIIGFALAGMVVTWLPWSLLPQSLEGTEVLSTGIGFVVIGCTLAALLLWQYHRRWTAGTRSLFVAAVAFIPICILIASTPAARRVAYPRVAGPGPLQMTMASNPDRSYTRTEYLWGESGIRFNVEASPAAPNTAVLVEGARYHFASADGWSMQTKWEKESITFTPGQQMEALDLGVKSSEADAIAARHATVDVEMALAVYRLDAARPVDTSSAKFDIPGVGHCTWEPLEAEVRIGGEHCSAPLRLPDLYMVQLDSAENTCTYGKPPLPVSPGHYATGVNFGHNDLPVEFDPDPIRTFYPSLGAGPWIPMIYEPGQSDPQSASVCRGTRYVVRTGSLQQRMQVRITLGPVGKEMRSKEKEAETPALLLKPKD